MTSETGTRRSCAAGPRRGRSYASARKKAGRFPDSHGYSLGGERFFSRKDDTNYVHWLSIAPRTFTAYSYGKRLVSVMVDGVVQFAVDPKSGQGGTGGEVRLFYEEEDGSGKFQLMVQNLLFDFRPGVPGWVK